MDSESETAGESASQQRRVQIVQSNGSEHELDALFDTSVLSKVKPLRERDLPPSFFQQPHLAARNSVVHSRTASLPISLQDSFAVVGQNVNMDVFGSPDAMTQFACANENQAPFCGATNVAGTFNNSAATPFATVNVNNAGGQSNISASTNAACHSRTFASQSCSQPYSQPQFSDTTLHLRQSSWDALSHTPASSAYQTVPTRANGPSIQAQAQTQTQQTQQTFERCKCAEKAFEPLTLDRLLPSARVYTAHGNPIISEELITLTEFGVMLPGWQYELTADRQLYFVDHACQRTTWFHPRIPLEQQRSVPYVVVDRRTYAGMLAELERRQRAAAAAAATPTSDNAPPLPPRDRLRQAQLGADQLAIHAHRRHLAEPAGGQPQMVQGAIHGRARSECYAGSNWQVTADQLDLGVPDEMNLLCEANSASAGVGVGVGGQPQTTAMHVRSASYPAHLIMDANVTLAGEQQAAAARGPQTVANQQFVAQNSYQSNWNGSARVASNQNLPNAAPFGPLAGPLAHPLTVAAPHAHSNVMTLSQHSQLTNSPSSLASSSPAHHLTASSSMEFHARQESSDSGLSSVPHTMPHTPDDTLAANGYSTAAAARFGTPPTANSNFKVAADAARFEDTQALALGVGPLDVGEFANLSLMTLQDDMLGANGNPSALSWNSQY